MLNKKHLPTPLSLTILLMSAVPYMAHSAQICSRVALINYQEVLVDVSNNKRGEGLRYYLEKDEVSKDLLDTYQENNRPSWTGAAMSTFGSAMILGGALRTSGGENELLTNRNFLIFGGATLLAVSYLISKTNQYNNEYLLNKSIEEYNKRNTPRIFFSPTDPNHGLGLAVGFGQEF
jgi:hypothetical protein